MELTYQPSRVQSDSLLADIQFMSTKRTLWSLFEPSDSSVQIKFVLEVNKLGVC